jgi:hypothetical protein
MEVARHDKEYDLIQRIFGHRFTDNRKRCSDLEFNLMWARGHEPVWERWNSTLAANEFIHDYLRQNSQSQAFHSCQIHFAQGPP